MNLMWSDLVCYHSTAADLRMDSSGKPSTAQMVVLATSSALTALFYSIYRSRAKTVARLKVSLVRRSLRLCHVECQGRVNLLPPLCRWRVASEPSVSTGSQESVHRSGFEKHPVWNTWQVRPVRCHRRCVQPPWKPWILSTQNLQHPQSVFCLSHTAGVVRNVKETLSSQFVDNCKGAIERLTLKEEKMVWNRTTHLW